MRLIDADALKKSFGERRLDHDFCIPFDETTARDLIDAPTIDPVKYGVWVGEGDGYADGEMVYDMWHCDQCNHFEETDDPETLPHYCPDCGAEMGL